MVKTFVSPKNRYDENSNDEFRDVGDRSKVMSPFFRPSTAKFSRKPVYNKSLCRPTSSNQGQLSTKIDSQEEHIPYEYECNFFFDLVTIDIDEELERSEDFKSKRRTIHP